MTNEHAIDVIKHLKKYYNDKNEWEDGYIGFDNEDNEAIDLAIKALKQQPCEDTEVIKVSKGAVKARQGRFVIYDVDWLKKNFYSTEEKIYGQPKQPCEDCISRQAVLDIITFEDKWLFDANGHNANTHIAFSGLESRVKALPPVTSQASEENIHREREQAYMLGYEDASKKFRTEPCEDCISRQAVDDAIYDYSRSCDVNYEQIMEFIDKLPSVTPKYTDEEIDKAQAVEQAYVDKMVELAVEETKRPKGKWIDDCGGVKCSCCGYSIDDEHYAKTYCTNCGAYMGGGEDG